MGRYTLRVLYIPLVQVGVAHPRKLPPHEGPPGLVYTSLLRVPFRPLSPPFSLLATLFLPSPHFFPVRLTKRASELLEFSDVIDLATRNKSKSDRRDLFASSFIY